MKMKVGGDPEGDVRRAALIRDEIGPNRYLMMDACRLGGVNEVLAVLLLAARFEIPVCPHAGGVGLSEYVRHLSLIGIEMHTESLPGGRAWS